MSEHDWSNGEQQPDSPWRPSPDETPPPPAPRPALDPGHHQPEPTVAMPPYEAPSAPPAAPAKRGFGFAAAVVAVSLIVGGAAGVGGAAWYTAWQDSGRAASAPAITQSSNANTNATQRTRLNGTIEAVAAAVLPSVVKINVTAERSSGSGSGIILDTDGHILTNNHVVTVGRQPSITVNFHNGDTVRAEVVGTDPVTDLAVIKVAPDDDLTPARIGSSGDLRVGQEVLAVGSPFGLSATVTTGIVSALNRPVSVPKAEPDQNVHPGDQGRGFDFGPWFGESQQQPTAPNETTYPAIQTDAAINPGNSGGALVDLEGQVVGVNSSIRTSGMGSAGSIGLGFAIPIDQALPIVNQLIAKEAPTHARLGIVVGYADEDALMHGAVVREVEKGGAADRAGLLVGDVITKVNDEIIDGAESLVATIRGHRPDEQVGVTVVRDGKTQTIQAQLGSDADAAQGRDQARPAEDD